MAGIFKLTASLSQLQEDVLYLRCRNVWHAREYELVLTTDCGGALSIPRKPEKGPLSVMRQPARIPHSQK